MKRFDVSLVLACYNEGSTLNQSLKKIVEILNITTYKWEIIAIDDLSKDSTYKILRQFSRNKKNFFVYRHINNIGRGGTVKEGIQKAKGNIVGFIDVDLEISPIYIPDFVRSIQVGWDVIIAKRIYKENLSSFFRWILSKSYNLLVRYYLDLNFQDTEAGYKFFNRRKILKILQATKDQGWFFDTEIIARSHYENLKIKEIPVLFLRRDDKKSTVRVIQDTLAYLKAIKTFKNNSKKI